MSSTTEWNQEEDINIRQIAFFNRQPSLFSHSCPAVKLVPTDSESPVMRLNPLFIEQLNADFDGDISAIYIPHSRDSLQECYDKAYYKNIIGYDADGSPIATIRHEALYFAYVLSSEPLLDKEDLLYSGSDLTDLPENLDLLNNSLGRAVLIDGVRTTYGRALLNKWMGADKIVVDKTITKKEIKWLSSKVYEEVAHKNSEIYYNTLQKFENKLFFGVTISKHIPTIDLPQMSGLLTEEMHRKFKRLPKKNTLLCYYLNAYLVDRTLDSLDKKSQLYKLFKSGSRFSKNQLSRSCINIGLVADNDNVVDTRSINTNLIRGLTPDEFFRSAPGTRKGIADKSSVTPDSGYLERTLVMAMAPITIYEDDCGCTHGIKIQVMSSHHFDCLIGKYFKLEGDEEWRLIDPSMREDLIEKEIEIRSAITCQTPDFKICRKCFGERPTRTEYIGIVAAQSMTERLTQLSMRTFHESGSAVVDTDPNLVKFLREHLLDFDNQDNERYVLTFDKLTGFKRLWKKFPGFEKIEGNQVYILPVEEHIRNNDTATVIENVKKILRKEVFKKSNPYRHPQEYYAELMSNLLTVGTIFSSYVEMLLAHMFMVNSTDFWRYNQDSPITMKLSSINIASKISPLLGFLFQPNKKSIDEVGIDDLGTVLDNIVDVDPDKLSIHEKIFLQKL